MAITLDTIVNKVFKVVKNGYDNNEVEAFLDEILEEMERREAETNQLKAQVAQLTKELEEARAAAAAAPAAAVAAAPQQEDRHAAESFELVLNKAKSAYEEIVAEADQRASEIVAKANEEAATVRTKAESQITELTARLASLRKQAAEYCDTVKSAIDSHAASIEEVRKLL